jgi:hypothetical protein
MTVTLHEDHETFLSISHSLLLGMRNISDKSCRGNHNTHFVCNNFFFLENRAVYETIWKNIVESGRSQMTVWRMRIARWVPKATNTQYIILIAFPLQQCLNESASTLRNTYFGCLLVEWTHCYGVNMYKKLSTY